MNTVTEQLPHPSVENTHAVLKAVNFDWRKHSSVAKLRSLQTRWDSLAEQIEALDSRRVLEEFNRLMAAATEKLVRGEPAPELDDLSPGWIAKSWDSRRQALNKAQDEIAKQAAPLAASLLHDAAEHCEAVVARIRKNDTASAELVGLEYVESYPSKLARGVRYFIATTAERVSNYTPESDGSPSPAGFIRDCLGYTTNDLLK